MTFFLPTVTRSGVGIGDVLYRKTLGQIDYVAIDRAGFYDDVAINKAIENREGAGFVDALMGDFHEDIHTETTDFICSISVLEHVPVDNILNCVKDIARTLKPGGCFVHPLDVHRGNNPLWDEYLQAIEIAGLELFEPAEEINFDLDGLLYEP